MISSDDLDRIGIPWCFRQDSASLAKTGVPFIINLDDKGHKGTHWTAARVINGVLYYADPFGTILNGWPPIELAGYPRVINEVSFQRPNTQLCGYYAICFVNAMQGLRGDEGQKEFEKALMANI